MRDFKCTWGPFFLQPGEEIEFYKKENVYNPSLENVVQFDAVFNDESHHFLLFEFIPGTAGNVGEGLREVTFQNAFQDAEYMVGWVDPDVTALPQGTAYKIDANATLDLNYHLINYATNGDSILAAEAYVNYYTDNSTPDLIEMHSELLLQLNLFILNDGQEYTFTDPVFDSGSDDTLYVWFLSSHTHKYGIDYDIYKRNPDGTKGEQLYEGFFNTTYDFNQGYYDWEHPGNLYLDEVYGEMVPVAENTGFIQEATYVIPGSANESAPFITFGLTTNDEMMLSFIQYTRERVPPQTDVGISEIGTKPSFMSVYPNPTNGNVTVRFNLKVRSDVQLTVINTLGQEVQHLHGGSLSAGQASFDFDATQGLDPSGLYLIRLLVHGQVHTARLVHR